MTQRIISLRSKATIIYWW